MLAASRPKMLTVSITAKHTADEESRIKEAAERSRTTVSEWAREAHLAALSVSTETRLLLSEILAVRKLVTGIQLRVARQAPVDGATIMAFAAEVDSSKFGWADAQIEKFLAKTATEDEEQEEEDEEMDETDEDPTA